MHFIVITLIIISILHCSQKENSLNLDLRKTQFNKKIDFLLNEGILSKSPDKSQSQKEIWKTISTNTLKKFIDSNKDNYLLIDARNEIEYNDSHIPSAICIPASKISKSDKLPKDKSLLLIFYCNGPKCTKSTKAAKKAIERGYTNILVYDEGIPEWKKQQLPVSGEKYPEVDIPVVSPKELNNIKKNIFLIDVRDLDEFKKGSISGTHLNAPLDTIEKHLKDIPINKEIVIFDHVGKQTLLGGRLLKKHGYQNVKRLGGGWLAWKRDQATIK